MQHCNGRTLLTSIGAACPFPLCRGENEEHAALNRGEEDTLQMWIGEPQLVTPLHYDVVFSVLHQIRGVKRIHMWPPSEYMKLCAHPSTHPSPRGSAVTDLGNIPASCPSFSKAKDGMVVSLVPGEALYMPQGWWHHIEQEDNNELPITLAMHYRPETWVGTGQRPPAPPLPPPPHHYYFRICMPAWAHVVGSSWEGRR